MNRPVDMMERPLRDLRLSVTDRCNFRCRYCMPEEIFGPDYPFLERDQQLSFDEMLRLVRIFVSLGVRKLRITGGEPLLRKGLPSFIRRVSQSTGIEDLALTTNGVLLPAQAEPLKAAGLERVNVSLDALDNETFRQMNGGRGDVGSVLEGIEAASAAGLKVKVNMVVKKGVNEDQMVPMARCFRRKGHILRFIEYMDVGNANGWKLDDVVSKRDILSRVGAVFPLEPLEPHYYGEVANRFGYQDGRGEIGVIASVSEPFCGNCTRARLSADGQLYTCLFASRGYDLRALLRSGVSDTVLVQAVTERWQRRTDRYSERRLSQTGEREREKIEMSYIGG